MTDSTHPTPPESPKKPIYTRPKFIISAISGIIFLILIFQNWESVSVDLFFITDVKLPASIAYIVFALIGFIVGWLVKKPKSPSDK